MSGTKGTVYSWLTSLKLTIFLLSFIAVASVIGTVILQRAGVEEYLSVYSESTYRIIHFFGLDDTYHSPWFLAAIVLFALNLSVCTYGRFTRFLKAEKATPNIPEEQALRAMQMQFSVKTGVVGDLGKALKAGYRTVREDEAGMVLEKGTISRYGVYMIHLSILIILAGSLVGLIFGYKGFMVLNKGETKGAIAAGAGDIKERPLGFSLRCKEFKVSFYPGGEPKDYVSSLEVIENGKLVKEKEIRVNDPLSYKGVNVYQASYGSALSFRFNIGGQEAVLKERDTFSKNGLQLMIARFEKSVHDFGPGVLVAYMDEGGPKTAWFLQNVDTQREKDIKGVKVRLEEITQNFYTGLQISKDPGVWIVWTGFAMILFGLYINFFIYFRRIYVRNVPDGAVVAGVAFKNREAFKEEFEKLKKGFSQ
jgi:cytochrome c biogenesis protein